MGKIQEEISEDEFEAFFSVPSYADGRYSCGRVFGTAAEGDM